MKIGDRVEIISDCGDEGDSIWAGHRGTIQEMHDNCFEVEIDGQQGRTYLFGENQLQMCYSSIIYLEPKTGGNPLCRCPRCGFEAKLMDGFSLLVGGFNGISKGDTDDIDKQECGSCNAKLGW